MLLITKLGFKFTVVTIYILGCEPLKVEAAGYFETFLLSRV
jgi:hypothetical protein